jgi:acyl-CoA synthetase (NDP forming)
MKHDMKHDFTKVFYPESIALVGASNNLLKWGSFLLSHLAGGGYPKEKIFPVNSHEERIHDMAAYPSLEALPHPVDLVIVTTPAHVVPSVLDDCARLGMPNVIVISSSFSEVGPEGARLEEEISRIAQEKNLTLLGPNTMGIVNTVADMYALGAPIQLPKGKISFVSQSGNVGAQMLGWAMGQGLGFGKFIGTGNEASIHCEELIEYFGDDHDTDLILAYIEGLDNGKRFVELCTHTSATKPIIVLKSGRTEAGGKAALSHTGSMAGSDLIYDAAFRQSGIIRADSSQEMLDLAKSFGRLPLPPGNRIGILTLGGGWGVIATDAAAQAGFVLPPLDDETTRICDELLPPFWSHGNPIDLVGNLSVDIHLQILEKMAASPNLDAIVSLGSLGTNTMIGMSTMVAQQEMQLDQGFFKSFLVNINERNRMFLDRSNELMVEYGKPIVFVEMQFLGDDQLVNLEQGRAVIFTDPEKAAAVLHKMRVYNEWLCRDRG